MSRSMTAVAAVLLSALVLAPTGARAAERASFTSYLAPQGQCAGEDQIGAPAVQETAAMACLVNWARGRRGLLALHIEPQLASAAQLKLTAEVSSNQFSHTPNGIPFLNAFKGAGYLKGVTSYRVGENLAWGQNDLGSPRSIMAAWLDSAEHRANLFDPRFRELGLAYQAAPSFLGYDGVSLWANTFGTRALRTGR